MSPCHNLEPSLVARDSSRLLSVKPNEWMHLSPFYTRMHGEWLRYAKSTSQFHWRFLLVRDVRGFQVNPLCRHDITSPFPPSGNGGYVRNLDVLVFTACCNSSRYCPLAANKPEITPIGLLPKNKVDTAASHQMAIKMFWLHFSSHVQHTWFHHNEMTWPI